MRPWPDITGARDARGGVCIGSRRSRSKECKTLLVFYLDGGTYTRLATKVPWMEKDSATIAILAEGLRRIVNTKLPMPYDRAGVVPQLVDRTLYLYEGGFRGTLFPRWKWYLHLSLPPFAEGLAMAIQMETLSDKLVATEDKRPPAQVTDDERPRNYARFYSGWPEYVEDTLKLKEAQP